MRKYTLVCLFFALALSAKGQFTTIHEDFNAACAGSGVIPGFWLRYSSTPTVPSAAWWHCSGFEGRPTATSTPTPGMTCTNTIGATAYIDTCYLLPPQLDLSMHPGSVYLRFDSKTTFFHLGGRLHVFISTDSPFVPTVPGIDVSALLTPSIGPGDSTDWVTHQVDLTPYKSSPFYIAFRYASGNTSSNAWYIDNVNISDTSFTLAAPLPILPPTGINLSGRGENGNLMLNFNALDAGIYDVGLYDLVGRQIYTARADLPFGAAGYSVSGLDLHPGVYIAKLIGRDVQATARIMVY